MTRFIGIDHVQLAAPPGCENEARAFYGNVLGWPELPKPATLLARGGVWFRCGSQEVHIGVQEDFSPAKKGASRLRGQRIGGAAPEAGGGRSGRAGG